MSSKDRFEIFEMTPEMMKRLGIDPAKLLEMIDGGGVDESIESAGEEMLRKLVLDRMPAFKTFILRTMEGIIGADSKLVVSGIEGLLLMLTLIMTDVGIANDVVDSYRKNASASGSPIDRTINRLLDAIKAEGGNERVGECNCPSCREGRGDSAKSDVDAFVEAVMGGADTSGLPRG